MLFSEGCYLDTFFSGLQTNAPYYQEITDIQRITLHNVGTPGNHHETRTQFTAFLCTCVLEQKLSKRRKITAEDNAV